MNDLLQLERELLSPPGDTIQESLDEMGMSQAELAERIGRPKEKINDIIKGREPITTPTAHKLEKALGVSASFWLNRETEYRRQLYEIEQKEFLQTCVDWLKGFPVLAMKKLGWLPDVKEKPVLADRLLSFFSVASPREWATIYVKQEISVAFRISLVNTQNPEAISAWLRMGELTAKELKLQEYDKAKFRNCLAEIKELAYRQPAGFADKLQAICGGCGVAVVYVSTLPKAPISGATRWFRGRPLIQLSGMYKTNDHFWFTFFHEAGHILLHGKKDVFLEDVKGTEENQLKEEEANEFAMKCLLPEEELQQVLKTAPLTTEAILQYADKFRTPAGVIIGQLQHKGFINYTDGNHLRTRVDLFP